MANRLKVAKIQAILGLHERGWRNRRIARELKVDRETVAKYIRAAACVPKPAKAPIGSDSKPAKALIGSEAFSDTADLSLVSPRSAAASGVLTGAVPLETPPCRSACEPYRQAILEKLEQGLSAQRIYQDLVGEGFDHEYHSVRRFVAKLRRTRPLPFRRMECEAGEEAQIDFGTGAWIEQPNGKRRRSHVFRIVLSHSRKGYSEAVYRQTTEDFIRSIENAFWHFGGVPKVLVVDNLKAAVKNPDWYDPDLNPKIQSFCEYYGCVILPAKPRTPRHKGKIESGVDYVQENGVKGHRFSSLEGENDHLLRWETTVADTRIHGTIRKQVGKLFQEVERGALQPLPVERFPFFHEGQRIVHKDGHVEVANRQPAGPRPCFRPEESPACGSCWGFWLWRSGTTPRRSSEPARWLSPTASGD